MAADLGKTLETHFVGLRRYATSLIGDYVEAEDLVQECLVRALSHEHVWDRVHNRRAYLFTILHNIYVDRRAKYRRNERHVPIDDVAGELHTPPEQHEGLEIRDFQRAIEKLPDNYKAVTLLVGLEGMSYQQAAHSLGVPVGTVMSRLSRGRKMLRRSMNGDACIGAIESLAAPVEENRFVAQEMKTHIIKRKDVVRHALLVWPY